MTRPDGGLILMLFGGWRRLLTSAVHSLHRLRAFARRLGGRLLAECRAIREYLVDTGSAWAEGPPTRLSHAAVFGLLAYAAGLAMAAAIALGSGVRAPAVGLLVLIELLWGAVRLTIVLLVLRGGASRRGTLIAFAAGLAPYALGVTAPLRLVSLALSARLTARGLRGAGIAPDSAGLAIGWAFGGQVVAMMLAFATRGGIAMLGGS